MDSPYAEKIRALELELDEVQMIQDDEEYHLAEGQVFGILCAYAQAEAELLAEHLKWCEKLGVNPWVSNTPYQVPWA